MTCDETRERLLADDPRDPGLAAHLSECAACGELAAAIVRADSHLRQHVEDFVNAPTLDAQWAAALDRAGPARPRWAPLVQRAVIVAAAAAALALVAVPIFTPGPESSGGGEPPSLGVGAIPGAIEEARTRVEAFEDLEAEAPQGLDQAAEDALLIEAFQQKVQAMTEAEAALLAAAEDEDPEWQATALGELADLYASMADALERFPSPSYLDAEQLAAYEGGLAPKIRTQREKALSMYAGAAEVARDHQLDGILADIEGRAADLRAGLEGDVEADNRELRRLLRDLEGEKIPWPKDLPEHLRPAGFERIVREAVAVCAPEVEIVGFECSEPPCLALLRPPGPAFGASRTWYDALVNECPAWVDRYTNAVASANGTATCPDGESEPYHVLGWSHPLAKPPGGFTDADEANQTKRFASRIREISGHWPCR